jgi:quinolinate synthase
MAGSESYEEASIGTLFWGGIFDSRICRELHPQHDRLTIQSLCNNVVVYPGGNCVVHHMFGKLVADAVEQDYPDTYVTAHLEVPGEMFRITPRKSLLDKGVVGSTSNTLGFIERKVGEAAVVVAATAL